MKRYGYMIKLGGDREIAAALARGTEGNMKLLPAGNSEAVRRVAMYQHSPEEWEEMRRDARRLYGHNRPVKGIRGALLVAYAMVCYAVGCAYDRAEALLGGER